MIRSAFKPSRFMSSSRARRAARTAFRCGPAEDAGGRGIAGRCRPLNGTRPTTGRASGSVGAVGSEAGSGRSWALVR